MKPSFKLSSESPAERWGEAYPVGNGHLGAMIFGTVPVNRVMLSENTFFSGSRSGNHYRPHAADAFVSMREKAVKGDYKSVHEAAEDFIGIRQDYGTNLPVGNLQLGYGTPSDTVTLLDRSLDIMTGIAVRHLQVSNTEQTSLTKQASKRGVITEKIYASWPNHMLVTEITGMDSFSLQIYLEQISCPIRQTMNIMLNTHAAVLEFESRAIETMHCDHPTGVTISGRVFISSDGVLTDGQSEAGGIQIISATKVYLCMNMVTDYTELMGLPAVAELNDFTCLQNAAMEPLCSISAVEREIKLIRGRHLYDVRKRMKRSSFELETESDPSLAEKITFLYQYGRYLLLSSSREDSVLPAHLQGIWNDHVACRIGWTCDMHLDINTQMNYWPSEITGLSETTAPLFRWIEEILIPEGRITAEKCYGLTGWVGEIVSNAWGYSAPYWASPIAPCPTGGVWILTHMWEHYLYTNDLHFLRNRAYPAVKEAVAFFKEYVFKDHLGNYTSGPSISPENSFLQNGQLHQISNGCTYEILMIRELFSIYLKIADILGEEEKDLHEIQEIRDQLLPYRIQEDGTIAEYAHDLTVPDRQHRHTSHLLGLYPFAQLTPEKTPELCKAAELTMRVKTTPIEQWEDTGWASSMLILYEARLKDGNQALVHMKRMINHLLEPNGMIYHPPTRGAAAFDHVYELDGNTGITAGIAEMLMQSHENQIQLLPALPDDWVKGRITGLKARGGKTVNIEWENHQLKSYEIKP